jgi:hypothetical protein
MSFIMIEQSRDKGNIEHKVQNEDKQSTNYNTENWKQIYNTDPTKTGQNPCVRGG